MGLTGRLRLRFHPPYAAPIPTVPARLAGMADGVGGDRSGVGTQVHDVEDAVQVFHRRELNGEPAPAST